MVSPIGFIPTLPKTPAFFQTASVFFNALPMKDCNIFIPIIKLFWISSKRTR